MAEFDVPKSMPSTAIFFVFFVKTILPTLVLILRLRLVLLLGKPLLYQAHPVG